MDVRRYFRGPLIVVLVVIICLFLLIRWASGGTTYQQVDTSKVVSLIDSGQVKSAKLIDSSQTVQVTTDKGETLQASWVGNQGQQLANTLQNDYKAGKLPQGYTVQAPSGPSLLSDILSYLPFILILVLFFLFMNQMQGGGSRVMNFGKSKAKLITKDTPKTTFADVAGA